MVASTRMRPPQRGQVNTVTANVWRTRSGHDDLRGAGGGEFSKATVVVDSRRAAGGGRHRLARASSDRHDRLACDALLVSRRLLEGAGPTRPLRRVSISGATPCASSPVDGTPSTPARPPPRLRPAARRL